jgi:hypothetical protein
VSSVYFWYIHFSTVQIKQSACLYFEKGTVGRSNSSADACAASACVDQENNHNASVSVTPLKICGRTRNGSGAAKSAAAV